MGVGQVLIDPTVAVQAGRVQFARRERNLAVRAIDPVAVIVDADEIVIGADFLQLGKRGQQRFVIPHANVAKGGFILMNVIERQGFDGREAPFLEAIERISLARELNGVGDVRALLVDLIRSDDETLDDLRIKRSPHDVDQNQSSNRIKRRADISAPRAIEEDTSGDDRKNHQELQHRQGGVNIRIAGAEHHSPRRIEQVVHGQTGPISDQQKEDATQHHQVHACRARHHRTALRHPNSSFHKIEEGGAKQTADQRHERQVVQEPREGQSKQIESQVDAEKRVGVTHHRDVPRHQIV